MTDRDRDFIAEAIKDYPPEKIKELADHNSETSNALYQSYLSKYPTGIINDRDNMLFESRFKYKAAEHAGGPHYD